MSALHPRGRAGANLTSCLLVGGAVLFSHATYARLWLTRPSLADYDAATAYVRARFEPGDHIEANPFWAERVRQYLGDLPLSALRHPHADDWRGHRRVWLFSVDGAEDGPKGRLLAGLGPRLLERQFGGINVRLQQVAAPSSLLFDFRERLESARVWIESEGRRHPCRDWRGGAWHCAASPRYLASREVLEIGGDPRAVISSRPASRRTMALEFEEVGLGAALSVGAGFPAGAAREGEAPVELTVEVDGRVVLRQAYLPGSGFSRRRVATPGPAGGRHRVTFRMATAHRRPRAFGVTAQAWD
ncbi:MAG TPA: hypothetical protein VMR21_00980 [Vicinamibacteria bacterium]|nr:hypothetical protein [Vicinamibacteria bacterium]